MCLNWRALLLASGSTAVITNKPRGAYAFLGFRLPASYQVRRPEHKSMRRFLYALGIVTLVLVILANIGAGVLVYKGNALDAESKAYVDKAVPAIAANWSKEQLLGRMAPELRATVTSDELLTFFNAVNQLGPMVKYEGASGQANMSYMTGSGSSVSASYVATVRCRNGRTTIRIALVKRAGRWMISGFHADASLFGAPGLGI
jgi:hypothetical protein